MTPAAAYRRLNKLLWLGRLPNATVIFADNDTIPNIHGITMHDGVDLFLKPVIVLNSRSSWKPTLIHEMLHVAEPKLPHGPVFELLVRRYWRIAQKNIKQFHPQKRKRTHVQ